MEYFLLQLSILLVGIFLIWKYELKLFKSKKHAAITLLIESLLIIFFDNIATLRQWWTLSGPGMLGITVGLLPIEEYSFAIIVPWFIIVCYKFVEKKTKR